jgi:DNA-binding NtrC family response regulator
MNPLRILLVDDEVAVLRAMDRLFTRRGHEVRNASSAEEAMGMLDTFVPEVVVSDFKMKGMNGGELLRLVAARIPSARRILLSGFAEVEGSIDAHFLTKPYGSRELLRVCEGTGPDT